MYLLPGIVYEYIGAVFSKVYYYDYDVTSVDYLYNVLIVIAKCFIILVGLLVRVTSI